MHGMRIQLILAVCVTMLAGCNPGVTVRKNPSHCDTGIRYYRPKPYLLLKPSGKTTTTGTGAKAVAVTEVSDEFVEISMEYLPDFSEEYSLKVRPGLGTATVNIGLEDGWNLTTIDQTLDSKFSENVGAITELAKAAASFGATAGEGAASPSPNTRSQKWVVQATNVPLGYYEAVVNEDMHGKKRLWGWRYVGFAPFNSCPTDIQGAQAACCEDYNDGAVYGLAFENGVMVFKLLGNLKSGAATKRDPVNTGKMEFAENSPLGTPSVDDAFKGKVVEQVREETGLAVPIADVDLDFTTANQLTITVRLNKTDFGALNSKKTALGKLKQRLDSALLNDAKNDFPDRNLTLVVSSVVSK